jgi:hypothetical protein
MPQTLFDWLVRKYPTAKRETLRRMLGDGRSETSTRRRRIGPR